MAEDKYNRKNPAVKRIMQEVKEMQSNPSDDFISLPLEIISNPQTRPYKMASPVITPEDVLETLMNDGTIDSIRLKIINQLKANEELKSNTIKMVEQSKVLNTPGAEKQTKRELFDALRQELETPVLEKASRSVWELILDQNGLGKEINETVERVFCQLSGCEPPLFPILSNEAQPAKEREDTPSTSSKKRSFNELSKEEADVAVPESANGSVPENTTKTLSPSSGK